MTANKQLQRTARDKVPSYIRQRAAAELRRYAALTLSAGFWRMRHICFLFVAPFIWGCASTNVYKTAAAEIFSAGREVGPAYTATYSPSDASFRTLMSDVDACVEQLEAERAEFLGSNRPSPQIATVQLLQCLRGKGWEIRMEQSITISQMSDQRLPQRAA